MKDSVPQQGTSQVPRRNPSSWDIARAAGVSQSTVSRVINKSPRISAATRARVEAAMSTLGYTRNAAARSLITGRSNLIGLVVSNITNPFYPELIESIVTVAAERAHNVVLCNTQESQDLQLACLELLIEQRVDGAILTSPLLESTDALLRRRLDRVPLVTVNRQMAGHLLDAVHLDNVAAGLIATDHLIRLGHRAIAFVGGLPSASTYSDRLIGVRQALAAADLTLRPAHLAPGRFTRESGYALTQALLTSRHRPTALVCADDLVAFGAIDAVLDAGLRVPADVAVIGFDDVAAASLRQVELTTVRQPIGEMGRRAVALLMDRIGPGSAADPVEVVLRPHLIVRRTCGGNPT